MQHLGSLPRAPLPVTDAVQTMSPYFFNTYINCSHLFTSRVSWKEFHMYFLRHIRAACYITCPFHDPHFHYFQITFGEHYTLWSYSLRSGLKFCAASTLLRLNIPLTTIFKNTKSTVTPQHETSFTPIQNNR